MGGVLERFRTPPRRCLASKGEGRRRGVLGELGRQGRVCSCTPLTALSCCCLSDLVCSRPHPKGQVTFRKHSRKGLTQHKTRRWLRLAYEGLWIPKEGKLVFFNFSKLCWTGSQNSWLSSRSHMTLWIRSYCAGKSELACRRVRSPWSVASGFRGVWCRVKDKARLCEKWEPRAQNLDYDEGAT